jgi:serine phosphatase RsbU (regulator of sigma subunit)
MVGAVKYADGTVNVVRVGDVAGHDVAATLISALNGVL